MCYTEHVKKSGISRLSEIQEIPDMRHAPLAQLDRASGYGPEGRGFESLTAYHREPIDFNGFAVFILSQDKLHTPFF